LIGVLYLENDLTTHTFTPSLPDLDRTRLRSVRTGLPVISTSKPGKI
jgi:hypothetical protein